MGTILVIVIIWIVVAFIYKAVKNVSFWTAFFRIPLIIVSFFLSQASSSNSAARARAKKEGRQDILDKLDEQEAARKEAKRRVDEHLKNDQGGE